MADVDKTGSDREKDEEKPAEGERKIQRSLKSMLKQMELSNEEIKYRIENFDNVDVKKEYIQLLKCTKCEATFKQTIKRGETVGIHPLLGVLMCDTCCDYYGDGNFSLDSEGEDKYCRWCGEGGTIFACSKCICGFCDECIKKHFGESGLEAVEKDDDWICYFCNPKPLWYLRSICSLANEAARNQRDQKNKETKTKKRRKSLDNNDKTSSDSCSGSSSSNSKSSEKKTRTKRKKYSRMSSKIDESSSSEDEKENRTYSRRRSFRKKKGTSDKESSGSESKSPRKKPRTENDPEFESKKANILQKLTSIWRLTETLTEVGLKSSRARLKSLAKSEDYGSFELLKKEHEELKSCMKVLVSSLSTASNSASSIKEDLDVDMSKDETESFRSQELKLKSFADKFHEGSGGKGTVDSVGNSSQTELRGGRRSSDRSGGGENRSRSLFSDSECEKDKNVKTEEKLGSGKESESVKPFLKVKSFARMLEANVYDQGKPVLIDLSDTDEGGTEGKKKKEKEDTPGKKNQVMNGRRKSEGERSRRKKKNSDSEEETKRKKKRGRKKRRARKDESDVETVSDSSGDDWKPSTWGKKEKKKDSSDEKAKKKSKKQSAEGKSEETKNGSRKIETEEDEESKEPSPEKENVKKSDEQEKEKMSEVENVKKKSDEEIENDLNEEEASKKSDEEEVAKKTDEEEVAKKSDEEEAGKKSDEEEAGKKSDEEEAGKRSDEEEVAKKTDEEEVEKKSDEEEVAKKSDEEEVAKKSDEENEKKSDEEAEEKSDEEENDKKTDSDEDEEKQEKKKSKKDTKGKSDSSDVDSSSSEKKTRRKTQRLKKDVKASFEKLKRKRKLYLDSSKNEDSQSKDEEKETKASKALESSESENENEKKETEKKKKKRILVSSDEDGAERKDEEESSEESEKENQNQKKSDSEQLKGTSGGSSSDEEVVQKVRKRVRRRKGSSDSSEEEKKKKTKKAKRGGSSSDSSGDEKKKKGRKNIKKILKKESLKVETKEALKNEEERKKRLKERQKQFQELFPEEEGERKRLILDFDPETKEPTVTVHKKLVKRLKPHQFRGVKFMWDSCFESAQKMEEESGSGCILAHCMGLGKTLQVVTLVHTVMTHDLGVNSVLVVCPLSTVPNWIREFESWLENIHTEPITLYDLLKYKKLEERRFHLKDWHENGGVLVISYDLFRTLTKSFGSKQKKRKTKTMEVFRAALLDPGPDLVICDEGHLLKNEDTALSKCMSQVKTARRIVLTGTPLQNNLIEYHCMVQFVKPNILGTRKEFCNRFVNPINNGQFEDSTDLDVKIMKRRSHVLHSMLDGCIQRYDYSVLTPFLPEKHEYVLKISLTETQAKAYMHFIDHLSAKSCGSSKATSLFHDYHSLQRIWTHPKTMLMQSEKETQRDLDRDSEGSLKDFVVSSGEESSRSGSDSEDSIQEVAPARKRVLRSNANDPELLKAMEEEEKQEKKHWWDEYYSENSYEDMRESNKLVILFSLLKYCWEKKDKVLVFSQSLYSLDLIEHFLNRIDESNGEDETLCGHRDTWVRGSDYFRLDGSTSSDLRTNWCRYFNKESNTRARLFLISTKAGGLGINLYGANRVVIFDASWNPSHDLQSIFRVYRFGQKKTCYIYRFLSEATMEEKIYERQVTKLSLAHRVVDEHQIERHYTMGNLQELYTFQPTPMEERKVPKLPKDSVLADILAQYKDLVVDYHEHDSLLENKQEEELSEEERKAAWKEYEEEKTMKVNFNPMMMQAQMMMQNQMLMQGQHGMMMQGQGMMQGLQEKYILTGGRIQPVFTDSGQNFINPMYNMGSIPLEYIHRGMQVGLTPLRNESADSFFERVVNREAWIKAGKIHTPNQG